MPSFHIQNIPEDLYRLLQQRAIAEHRSLSVEVVLLLEQAVAADHVRVSQAILLERMRHHRRTFCPSDVGAPGSVDLLREDRDR